MSLITLLNLDLNFNELGSV